MKYVQVRTLVDNEGKPYSGAEAKVIKELYHLVRLAVRSAMTEEALEAFDQNRSDEADQKQEKLILDIITSVSSFFLLKSYSQQVGKMDGKQLGDSRRVE